MKPEDLINTSKSGDTQKNNFGYGKQKSSIFSLFIFCRISTTKDGHNGFNASLDEDINRALTEAQNECSPYPFGY